MLYALDSLTSAHYLLLVTFRANGDEVPTPVWFGEHGGRLYLRTVAGSPKTQRIAENPRVEVSACEADGKPLGERLRGQARRMSADEAVIALVDAELDAKYGEERISMTRSVRDEQGVELEWIEVVLDQ